MKNVTEYLENLGFSENETKLYLTLIASGPMTASELAKTAHINRTAAYTHIASLIEKGVLLETLKGPRRLFAALEPERLHYFIDNSFEEISILDKQFPQFINIINTMLKKPVKEDVSTVKYYQGLYNMRKCYEEAFNSDEFRSYVKVEEKTNLSPDNPTIFNNAFKKNKKLKIWEIIYESPFSRRQAIKVLSENNNRYFYKFMPSNLKWDLTSQDILIYDGKVAIINYNDITSSVVLQNADFYKNSKGLFDFIWSMLPEPKQ